MKDIFNCFYDTTETKELDKIWRDDDTLFIFDTNVLLSLYSFQPDSRKDFLKVLASIQNRIWIPFHVGLEFQKNRLTVIKNRRSTFNDLNKDIDKLTETITFDKKPFTALQTKFSLKKNYPSVFNKLNDSFKKIDESFIELGEELKKCLKSLKDEIDIIDKEKIFVNSKDEIREEIDGLFTGDRIGKNTFDTPDKLNILYKEGNERYKNKIPPGYEDEVKGEEEFYFDGVGYKNKFGDLIIFKQIIDFSKENSIKNVIFISEDIKKDWRHIEDQGGDKILGARPELKRELYKEAGVENFLIYQIEDFVKKTNEYLNIQIEDQTLKSIKLSLEEDKHQRAMENNADHSSSLTDKFRKLQKNYDKDNAYAKAAEVYLESQKLHNLYDYDSEYAKTAKAYLESQKLHNLYDKDNAYAKAAEVYLESQKLHNLYDYDSEYAKAAKTAKAYLESQKLHNLYDYDSEYAKAAEVYLESQKLHNLYDHDSDYAKAIKEVKKQYGKDFSKKRRNEDE